MCVCVFDFRCCSALCRSLYVCLCAHQSNNKWQSLCKSAPSHINIKPKPIQVGILGSDLFWRESVARSFCVRQRFGSSFLSFPCYFPVLWLICAHKMRGQEQNPLFPFHSFIFWSSSLSHLPPLSLSLWISTYSTLRPSRMKQRKKQTFYHTHTHTRTDTHR